MWNAWSGQVFAESTSQTTTTELRAAAAVVFGIVLGLSLHTTQNDNNEFTRNVDLYCCLLHAEYVSGTYQFLNSWAMQYLRTLCRIVLARNKRMRINHFVVAINSRLEIEMHVHGKLAYYYYCFKVDVTGLTPFIQLSLSGIIRCWLMLNMVHLYYFKLGFWDENLDRTQRIVGLSPMKMFDNIYPTKWWQWQWYKHENNKSSEENLVRSFELLLSMYYEETVFFGVFMYYNVDFINIFDWILCMWIDDVYNALFQ